LQNCFAADQESHQFSSNAKCEWWKWDYFTSTGFPRQFRPSVASLMCLLLALVVNFKLLLIPSTKVCQDSTADALFQHRILLDYHEKAYEKEVIIELSVKTYQ
jgi:hypothetical protein